MRCTALILLVSRWLRIIWTRKGTKAVQHQNIVFHGLLKHVPWAVLDQLVEQYEPDADPRGLPLKAHLIALLYGQFGGAVSLREIETGLRSHASKLYHLGGETVSREGRSQWRWGTNLKVGDRVLVGRYEGHHLRAFDRDLVCVYEHAIDAVVEDDAGVELPRE